MVLGSYPFSPLSGYGRPSFLLPPPSGLYFCKFFPFFFLTFWTQITWSLAIGVFTPIVYFFLAISPFLPKFFSFFVDWCPLDSNLPFCVFLCFKLMTSTLIVYLLTIGVLLPPIVMFSVLLCGLASLDSNLPFFFWLLAFSLSAFLLLRFFAFGFLLLRFCYHAPTKKPLVCRSAASWLTKPKTRS